MYFQIIHLCQDLRGKSGNLCIARLGCGRLDSENSAVDISVLRSTCSYVRIKSAAAFQW